MKIALTYGLLITVCFIAWVVIAHLLVPNPQSLVHSVGAGTFVNIIEILAIFLGIKAKRKANAGELKFKEGLKTGVAIAVVYGVSACLFFLVEILLIGPKVLAGEPGAETRPIWQAALGAFLGLFLGAVLLGLLYSTIISFLFAVRRKE